MASPIGVGGFGTPTTDDRRPWLWVVSIVSCTYSILTLAARLMSKFELLAIEDALITCAYVLAIVHWALFDRATYVGFGMNATQSNNLGKEGNLFFSSQAVLLAALYLTKISVLWFGRRIFSGTKLQVARVFEVAIGFATICGVVSVALFSADCDFGDGLRFGGQQCKHLNAKWTVIQVLDALTEVVLVALPTYYVSINTINLSSKITVFTLFGLRLPCIAFMAATAASYRPIEHGLVHTKNATSAGIWSEVLLGYALCSASFPCIRTFLTAFLADSKYRIHHTTLRSGPYASRSGGTRQQGTQESAGITPVRGTKNDTSTEDEARSVASDASQRMMIERSVDIDVAVESASSSKVDQWPQEKSFPYQGPQ